MELTEWSWQGYGRKHGAPGIRNRVLVIYTVKCSEFVARRIVEESGHPDVELVNISYENEEQSIEDMLLEALEEYPDTAGIFCTNENVTESVLETVGRLEDKEIKIVGFDAGEVQIQAIRDGREYGTVCQNPYGMGYAAVVAALRAASGQTVDNWIDPGYQWVDRNNIDVEENKKYLYL